MQVDYSVELGRDDSALELPWFSADPSVVYFDLKAHPDLIMRVPEAIAHPELREFFARINAPGFPLQTAKCDAWHSREILPEEEIFAAECKFVSYIDLVFSGLETQLSFEKHEELARDLCKLLMRAPELPAAVDFVIRRCYYHREKPFKTAEEPAQELDPNSKSAPQDLGESQSGFCLTAYVLGFGNSSDEASKQWSITLALLQHALMQLANRVGGLSIGS
ncbi:MAG: hypothetical protein WA738_18325 [Candidatus Angelobacter sp.]